MKLKYQKKSITLMFPLYKDKKTVKKMIYNSLRILKKVTKNYEIIAVDDGCPEKSGEIVKKFSKANKFNASACVVFGEEEWKSNKLIFKDLVSGSQSLIDLKDIKEFLNKNFGLK